MYPGLSMRFLSGPRPAAGRLAGALAMIVIAAACAPPRPPMAPAPAPLPVVPERIGDITIDVVYPAEGGTITASDSTFIFGTVGSGDATLTINGAPVRVAPNGAWLAFLPVPADGVYRLEASARGQTVQATRTVQVPARAERTLTGRLEILEGSVMPSGVLTRQRGERIDVRVQGTPGARATLLLPDGRRIPLSEQPVVERQTGFLLDRAEARRDVSAYVGSFTLETPILGTDTAAVPMLTHGPGYVEARERRPEPRPAVIELVHGGDTVRTQLTASIGMLETGEVRAAVTATDRPDSTTIGRKLPGPGQLFQYFFPNGTRLQLTGEAVGFYRVQLAEDLHIWVPAADVELLPAGTPTPRGEVGTIEVRPEPRYARISFSMTERLPYDITVDERALTVTFYGATGRTSFMGYGRTDPFVRQVRWEQATDEVYRVHIELSEPLWGFRHGWDERGNLELHVRRAPRVDAARPLQGVVVAVDAGHPPGGAIGPTRLTEADANLMVARRLVPMLERAGAQVLEIRPDTATVPLIQRPIMAAQADADMLVSIHFNAFPDGVNPFANHGTLVLYYWPHSLAFARHLQRELLAELGRPDRGVRFQDLALPRTTWMPSVLTETEFMMLPEVEAALRDPSVQERIARAHFRAIEAFLRASVVDDPQPRR
jgi:N-acetylmuramoyl-L-alanine amidase